MTKKNRTVLFFVCLLFFLILSPSLILYSQGYRVDFKNKKLTKTGALYFKILPKNSDVYLDGKWRKQTDFLFGTVLLDNLLPGQYSVEIKKDGYTNWRKKLEVKASQVNETKNVVLFPNPLLFKTLAKGVEDYFPSPNGEKIILKKNSQQGWYLTLFDAKTGVDEILVEEKNLLRKNSLGFLNLKWSPDSQKLILSLGVKEKEEFLLLDWQKRPVAITWLDYLNTAEEIEFNSQDSNSFLAIGQNRLSAGDFASKKPYLISENVLAFATSQFNLYLLDKLGFVYRADNVKTSQKTRLNETALELKDETPYQLISDREHLFLLAGENLLILDEKLKEFREIAPSVIDFVVSPDDSKLAYTNGSEIWVFFLKDALTGTEKKAEDKTLLARFSDKIDKVFWLNNNYLVFAAGNKIEALETDERDQPNLTTLTEFKKPRVFFDGKNLTVLAEENLQLTTNLLP